MGIKIKKLIRNPKLLESITPKGPVCLLCGEEIANGEKRRYNNLIVCVDCYYTQMGIDTEIEKYPPHG